MRFVSGKPTACRVTHGRIVKIRIYKLAHAQNVGGRSDSNGAECGGFMFEKQGETQPCQPIQEQDGEYIPASVSKRLVSGKSKNDLLIRVTVPQ